MLREEKDSEMEAVRLAGDETLREVRVAGKQQGGNSIDIENLGHQTGKKTGHDIRAHSGTRPNIVLSFVPSFVPRMSIESPPRLTRTKRRARRN